MWMGPLIISIVLAVVLLVLQRQDSNRARRVRYRFIQLYKAQLADLDRLRIQLIKIFESLSSQGAGEPELELYERAVQDFERLLISMRAIPLSNPNFDLIKAASLLVKNSTKQIERLQARIVEAKQAGMTSNKTTTRMAGCYFCSKPAVSEPLRRVRLKIDGETKQVIGCLVCRTAMKQNRTAKVLFFNKNGQSLHWSQIEDFKPEESYFQINSPTPKELGRHQLRLVYSTDEKDREDLK
jgi:hypothetical protein